MTRARLVWETAEKTGISQKAAGTASDTLVPAIRDPLKGLEAGFRNSDLRTVENPPRRARIGVDSRSGRKIRIRAAQVPPFSAVE